MCWGRGVTYLNDVIRWERYTHPHQTPHTTQSQTTRRNMGESPCEMCEADRLALRNDVQLCKDVQRVFRGEYRTRVAVTLLVVCKNKNVPGEEFVRGVMRLMDYTGDALELLLKAVGAPEVAYDFKCHKGYKELWRTIGHMWDGDLYPDRYSDRLRDFYDRDVLLSALHLSDDRRDEVSIHLCTALRRNRHPSGSQVSLRNPAVCAALIRTLVDIAPYAFVRYGHDPDWEALPYGSQLRRLWVLVGDEDDAHRRCDTCTLNHSNYS